MNYQFPINFKFNLFPISSILFHFSNRISWCDLFSWPLHNEIYRSTHFMYPFISSSIAWQGLLISYSTSIFSFVSSSIIPHLSKLSRIRALLFLNFLCHFCFQSESLLIYSEERISKLIFSKLFTIEIAVSSVSVKSAAAEAASTAQFLEEGSKDLEN